MKLRTAISMALIMSGRYDVPGQTVIVRGLDQFGEEITETHPDIDCARVEADVEKVLVGLMPSPIRRITSVSSA